MTEDEDRYLKIQEWLQEHRTHQKELMRPAWMIKAEEQLQESCQDVLFLGWEVKPDWQTRFSQVSERRTQTGCVSLVRFPACPLLVRA